MPLFQRTLKLTLATCLAAFLASFLGANYAITAGIIAILSVSETRRTTFKLAYQRFLSSLLALILGGLVFSFLGFHIWSLAPFLLLYIPLAYRFRLEIGITPSTVLVTHLLLEQSIAPSLLANEILIFLIGSLSALLVILYIPDRQQELDHYHDQVEELLRSILNRFVYFLRSGDGRNDAKLVRTLDDELHQALEIAYLDQSDQILNKNYYHVAYFEMRQAQNYILQDMARNINSCQLSVQESQILADLFQDVADQLSQLNPAQDLLDQIENYLETFRKRPLPQSREEFETRAVLLQLLKDLQQFVQLKVDFASQYPKQVPKK
ncbi:aromatic acid exporter family protein [Streptococcus sp. NLN64]|uniref:aromatic acid exporter family protein n=1 Tax=Streptococcus sp. NLN64 TaxID=2822799 RepID=UPI0018C98673|nr:aromatic acid exporter family protein [Streptococcus sp. NLN64]MBG9367742.1 aromatic acid exporter family protein [Streptococcus sp. NLN64]